jgi:A/G-specific adenine glycosylase
VNDVRALRASILRWYRKHRRDLPWRRSHDPYAIWLSEIMLQQTRVETVIPYYERFLARFPTIQSLARAREADVLALWSGLGYYSRARSLKAAADLVVREHAGRLPDDAVALRELPGIGPYTAAAIASVAFGRPEAAVDWNVIRVLARIGGWKGRRDEPALRRRVESFASELARGTAPGDWTQALMELGALVCAPAAPRCDRCPAASRCIANRSGDPARFPTAARKASPSPTERRVLLVARRGSKVLLTESESAWNLPSAPVGRHSPKAAAARVARAFIAGAEVAGPRAEFRHRTYAEDLRFEIWEARAARSAAPLGSEWVDRDRLRERPLRAPTLKALKALRLL